MSRRPLIATALLGATLSASAGDLQVTVTNAAGDAVANAVVTLTPAAAWSPQAAPEGGTIVQKDIRFEPYVTAIPVGTTLRFVNRDGYDHHVRSLPGGPLGAVAPAKQFEFRLAAFKRGVESASEVKFDLPGSVLLGCHLHGSMRGHVFIARTPWTAVTDDAGRVHLSAVPDGQAELALWHPDQLTEQKAQRVQVGPGATAAAQLNFSPRRRPPPRPKGDYEN